MIEQNGQEATVHEKGVPNVTTTAETKVATSRLIELVHVTKTHKVAPTAVLDPSSH